MANQVHILNGDATVPEFEKSGIEGDTVIWREVLCEGPITDPILEDLFWQKRATYIYEVLGGDNYEAKMLSELDKIRDLSNYNEVVLWFEYDLFCQVNMLACLNFIQHDRISMICLGDELNGKLQGLGEIRAADFNVLYDNRALLSDDDIRYAKKAWKAYAHITPDKLPDLPSCTTYKHLIPAIEAHLTRLPGKNGLNQVEEKMLRLIQSGIDDDRKLVGTMLRDQGYFGLGDLQYFQYLDQLSPLLKEEKLEINELGNKVLEGLEVFLQPIQFIGGVFRPDYWQKLFD